MCLALQFFIDKALMGTYAQELPSGEWFCCSDCNRIHSALQNLLVSGAEKLTDSLLDVTRKQHIDKGLECVTNFDVKWRLLSAKISSRENKLLLSEACAIFHVSMLMKLFCTVC